MTVQLTIRTAMWRSHVAGVVAEIPNVIPVVKGNGYGFGRRELASIAAEFADTVAVGTVHELSTLPQSVDPLVLSPTLRPPDTTRPILTIGNEQHIEALAGWNGRVTVKLASSMLRYGRGPSLIDAARASGLDVVSVSIHPALAGTMDDHRDDIVSRITEVDETLPVWVSHLDAATFASLPSSHAYRIRLGTTLWHGDKSTLHLSADALDIRWIKSGTPVGYRLRPVTSDGHVVMIGAGTAQGVTERSDGKSPFHFARARLALHEPPHMHTSMVFVADGDPLPAIGDFIDLQRPLHMTNVDEYVWL